jgi:hypothetical protein
MSHRHVQYSMPYITKPRLAVIGLTNRRFPGFFQFLPGQQAAVSSHGEQLAENL